MKIINLNKLMHHFTGKSSVNPVNVVARRFLQAFQDHGVEASQIPRLLTQVNLDDLQSPEKLIAALNPEILDQTAKLFGIRSQWLEGVDDRIYEYRACYKHPGNFFDHLISLNLELNEPLIYPLRMLSAVKKLDWNDSDPQLLAPVLVEKIAELSDEWIYRYHIYQDGFDWGHAPARIELKALTRLYHNTFNEKPVPLYVIKPNEMDDLLEGKLIPMKFVDRGIVTHPSLEDYALTDEESCVAKEVDEIPKVLKFIHDLQLEKFVSELLQSSPPDESVLESQHVIESFETLDSDIKQVDILTKGNAARGITKGTVINAFEGMHFERDQWSKYLASPPKWLAECRVARGNKSASATWSPVLIATALFDRKIPIKRLDAVFVRLPEWADEWLESSEAFR